MDATVVVILIFLLAGVLIGLGLSLSRRAKRLEREEKIPGEVRTRPTPTAPPKTAPPPVVTQPEPGVVVEEPAEVEVEAPPELKERLGKTRGVFARLRGRNRIDDETWDDLEEALLRADVGVRVTDDLLGGLRTKVKAKEITEPDQLLEALQAEMVERLETADRSLHFDEVPGGPNVWLFVGVNGVGKTTTIGKVGAQQAALGRTVLMAAGDTFRAAAVEQLGTWAERSGAEIVRGNEGGDPSAVIFDAIERATARHIDLVLGDTAGRLHTKTNLMEELRKIERTLGKKDDTAPHEVLLVVDATAIDPHAR